MKVIHDILIFQSIRKETRERRTENIASKNMKRKQKFLNFPRTFSTHSARVQNSLFMKLWSVNGNFSIELLIYYPSVTRHSFASSFPSFLIAFDTINRTSYTLRHNENDENPQFCFQFVDNFRISLLKITKKKVFRPHKHST